MSCKIVKYEIIFPSALLNSPNIRVQIDQVIIPVYATHAAPPGNPISKLNET